MLRANFEPAFFRKFLFISLACLGFSLWCFYDALVVYPAEQQRAFAYEKISEELTEKDQVENISATWRAYAEQQNWDSERPEKTAKEVGEDVGKQYFMVVICTLFGVPCFIKWMRGRGTWIEGDEVLIRNSRGQEVPVADITKIDKRKWEKKGIAYVHHSRDGKKQKPFVMDDFKYERDAMSKILMFAEANLSEDQIVGGKSERQRQLEAEEKKRAIEEKQAKLESSDARNEGEVGSDSDD